MKLSSIFAISGVLGSALAQSIQLPHLPDGGYLMSIDKDGKPTWTELANTTTEAATLATVKRRGRAGNSARLNKRFNWPSGTYPHCPGGDWFVQGDFYDHGWNAFFEECYSYGDRRLPAEARLMAQYQGSSVTYMCIWSSNPCNTEEWIDAVDWISKTCIGRSNGWMEPGMLWM